MVSSSNLKPSERHVLQKREIATMQTIRAKLLCEANTGKAREEYSMNAQVAVVDVRIQLSYEPWHTSTTSLLEGLVASHMRIIHSINHERNVIRSSYPSEPLLAEAAALQLHCFRLAAQERTNNAVDPAITIIRNMVNTNLLDVGELGEMCARLLLTLAHDAAIVREHQDRNNSAILCFSQPVSTITFFEELLSGDVAKAFLKSEGDLPRTLEEPKVFKDEFECATINFTHFVKWDKDGDISAEAAMMLYARQAAVITKVNCKSIDIAIPMHRNRYAKPVLHPDMMTMIFCQIKNRNNRCPSNSVNIDVKKTDFFTSNRKPARPYISLDMELGIRTDRLDTCFEIPGRSSRGRNAHRGSEDKEDWTRYAINVYGCSSAAYKVIRREDEADIREILQKDSVFDIYTRGDQEGLKSIIQNQLPTVDTIRLRRGTKRTVAGETGSGEKKRKRKS